jgi:hypothetical protein
MPWSGLTCTGGACLYTSSSYTCTNNCTRCKTPFNNNMT